MMISIYILTVLFNLLSAKETLYPVENVTSFLYEYGYFRIEDNISLELLSETSISNALFLFQEFYKLPADGKLNNKTVELMFKPRCGNVANLFDFSVSSAKWTKSVVTWHYYLANQELLEMTSKAFALWEQHSGIRFQHNRTNADILISNKRLKHMMLKESAQCNREFDCKGGKLAHAFFPDYSNSRREIHIDEEESWSYSTGELESPDCLSLYATLIHEI